MRTFEHFPEQTTCLICGTNEDKECTLVGIDGSSDGKIEEAVPIHTSCLQMGEFRYNKDCRIFYKRALL